MMKLSNRPSFFVTGGTGFIGSRLIEVLRRELGAHITALAHRTSPGALRLAAADVELDFTSITDVAGLTKTIAGHDAVFHLAFGQRGSAEDMRRTTVDGTAAMINAALAAKVPRFINVSTAAVYFGAQDGEVDETATRRRWGWPYADNKLIAEDAVRAATVERGLKGSIFEVAGVYGPWGETFVTAPLGNMRRGMIVLPNYGRGITNLTYVDDVVQALVLGLKDRAIGETFIIKGPGTVTRREAYAELEKMLGYRGVEVLSTEEVKAVLKGTHNWRAVANLIPAALNTLRESPEFRDAVRKTPLVDIAKRLRGFGSDRKVTATLRPAITGDIPAIPLIYPPAIMVDYLAASVAFSSAKASRLLGYTPCVSLEEGMAITHEWAEWANLLGPRYDEG